MNVVKLSLVVLLCCGAAGQPFRALCCAASFAQASEQPVAGTRFVLIRAFDYQKTRIAEFTSVEGSEREGLTALVRGCQRGQGTMTLLFADGDRQERWNATGQELPDLLAAAACRAVPVGRP